MMSNVSLFVSRRVIPESKSKTWLMRVDGGKPSEPGLYLHCPTLPKRFHRFMMRMFLGWRVIEGSEPENGKKDDAASKP